MQGEEAGQFGFEFEQFLSVSADGEGIVDPVFVDHEVTDGFERASFREKRFETVFVFYAGPDSASFLRRDRSCFCLETNFETGSVYDTIRSCVRFKAGFRFPFGTVSFEPD